MISTDSWGDTDLDRIVIEPENHEELESQPNPCTLLSEELDMVENGDHKDLDTDSERSAKPMAEGKTSSELDQETFPGTIDEEHETGRYGLNRSPRDLSERIFNYEKSSNSSTDTFHPTLSTIFEEAKGKDDSVHSYTANSPSHSISQDYEHPSASKVVDDRYASKHETFTDPLKSRAAEDVLLAEANLATRANTLGASVKSTLLQVIKQRDALQTRLTYAISAFKEQEKIFTEFDEIAASSQAMLFQGMEEAMMHCKPTSRKVKNIWIGGTWLAGTSKALQAAEKSWESGRSQEALSKVSQAIVTKDISIENILNAQLLRAAILRSSGQGEKALQSVEEVIQTAHNHSFVELTGKAQFHRGLSLLYLNRFAEASWVFLLASHTRDHGAQIEVNRQIAEAKRLHLPAGDPQRYLPSDFLTYKINRSHL